MVLTYSKADSKAKASDFCLIGVDEKMYELSHFDHMPILVVVFTCNHCPYANAIEHRLIDFQRDYQKHVQLVAINSNDALNYPEDSFAGMQRRAREKEYNFPYLYDEQQVVAKAYGAVCTPDIFVFTQSRQLGYHGRFDDNWKDEANVTRQDLRLAVDALLQDRAVDFEIVPSMGCSIKWKELV